MPVFGVPPALVGNGALNRTHEHPLPPSPAPLHLSGVADELQSRIAGNHGAQVGERAGGVEPAPGAIRFDGVKKPDHCKDDDEEESQEELPTAKPLEEHHRGREGRSTPTLCPKNGRNRPLQDRAVWGRTPD